MTEEPLFSQIKDLFYSYFDHPWLVDSIEEIGAIRTFLSLQPQGDSSEYHLVLTGIHALRSFIRTLRSSVVPNANLYLNTQTYREKDPERMLLKKCILYTLPENTRKLDDLTLEYEKNLMRKSLLY